MYLSVALDEAKLRTILMREPWKEPPDVLLSAYVRGLAGYTCGRGGCIPLLVRSANQ